MGYYENKKETCSWGPRKVEVDLERVKERSWGEHDQGVLH